MKKKTLKILKLHDRAMRNRANCEISLDIYANSKQSESWTDLMMLLIVMLNKNLQKMECSLEGTLPSVIMVGRNLMSICGC